MPITMHYAGALALLFLVLSIRVIQGRTGKEGPSLGDGGNKGMLRRIRGHANFAEYVPLILIMMALLEIRGASAMVLHALGASLLIARLSHGITFAFLDDSPIGRTLGAGLTLLVLGAAGVLCLIR
jgi:uncharacterized membrane protein YecN with MAPEG domain